MRSAFPSAAFAMALALAACGQSNTTTTSTPDGSANVAATAADGNTGAVNSGDVAAQITTGPGAAAAQLPDFLPLYPSAKVTSSFASPDTTGQGGSVAFETPAPPADVIAFYKQKVAAQGLRELVNANSGDTMTYMAGKEKMVVQVIASKGARATETVLSWTVPRSK